METSAEFFYVYDGSGNIVRSIDILSKKEYNYFVGNILFAVLYYFLKNLQGDIIAITNNKGKVVASYTYDAWGVCTIVSDNTGIIASINPFRYRGYYYDQETGLFYLQSRYYDPSVGRFVNGDAVLGANSDIQSYDLYSYCGNSPVFRIDTHGCAWWSVLIIAVAVVVAVVAVAHIVNGATAIYHAQNNKKYDTTSIVYDQNDSSIKDMKFGATTIGEVGCGAIATHNAIILAGGSSSLADVVGFMQARDLTLGFAGVYFTNIQSYLKRKGYSNNIYLNKLKNNIDKKIKNCNRKIAILAYKNATSGHYIAIQYKKTDKRFYIFNGPNNKKNSESVKSVDTWIKNNKSRSPLCLITV